MYASAQRFSSGQRAAGDDTGRQLPRTSLTEVALNSIQSSSFLGARLAPGSLGFVDRDDIRGASSAASSLITSTRVLKNVFHRSSPIPSIL